MPYSVQVPPGLLGPAQVSEHLAEPVKAFLGVRDKVRIPPHCLDVSPVGLLILACIVKSIGTTEGRLGHRTRKPELAQGFLRAARAPEGPCQPDPRASQPGRAGTFVNKLAIVRDRLVVILHCQKNLRPRKVRIRPDGIVRGIHYRPPQVLGSSDWVRAKRACQKVMVQRELLITRAVRGKHVCGDPAPARLYVRACLH